MTLKQKHVAKDLLENIGKPIGQAMRDAGYSEATAKNPDLLTGSKGWADLMEAHFPDETLASVHEEGLKAMRVISAIVIGKNANEKTNDFIEVPDHPTRHKFLETAYKLKKYMKEIDEQKTTNTLIILNTTA